MKKFLIAIFAVCLAFSVVGCTISAKKHSANLNTYTASLQYDQENHTLSGKMKVDFINKSNTTLRELRFNLFANAFRENSKQPVIGLAKSAQCYYNGKSYGQIDITNVYADRNLNFEICGEDQNVLKIVLPQPVQPTLCTSINMDFLISLPNISHRFGYGENTINFGNFLPTLCVFSGGQWQEILYHSNGDPFFSECANYIVDVSYPENLALAHTGEAVNTEFDENIITKKITALAVRDFAMVLSSKFQLASTEANGITINYFYHSDLNFSKSLDTAKKAMTTFCSLFGKYPYAKLDVVEANFCIGGMEFPNLVLVSDTIEDFDAYQMVIVHEIAHQWWYGVVGNDQSNYAWLDEGLAEFSTALFFEKNSGYEMTYDNIIATANTNLQVFKTVHENVLGGVDSSMNKSVADFASENAYIITTYTQGLLMFDALKKLLSENVVIKCLKNYFLTYAFQIVTPADLIASFEKTTSCNLEPFFNSWIEGKVVLTN